MSNEFYLSVAEIEKVKIIYHMYKTPLQCKCCKYFFFFELKPNPYSTKQMEERRANNINWNILFLFLINRSSWIRSRIVAN